MAVTPNTNFTAGAILTAAQQNKFPRGLMTDVVTTSATPVLTVALTTQMTAASFTAVTGRIYRISYFEPRIRATTDAGTPNSQNLYIFNGATQLNEASTPAITTNNLYSSATCLYVGALTAGATIITAQANTTSTTGTAAFQRTATRFAILTIEDIGAA